MDVTDISDWIAILLNWIPMLLLIGVWIFFMRNTNSKENPWDRQNDLHKESNAALNRIADTLEKHLEQK